MVKAQIIGRSNQNIKQQFVHTLTPSHALLSEVIYSFGVVVMHKNLAHLVAIKSENTIHNLASFFHPSTETKITPRGGQYYELFRR